MTSVAAVPGGHLDLPQLDELSDDERLFLRVCLGWVRGSAEMWRRRLMEAHVGRVLDARWPLLGNSPWDLDLDGIRIQVRASQAHVPFKLGDPDGSDVFIFVVKPTGSNDTTNACYWVVSARDVAALGRRSISPQRLAARHVACSAAQLAVEVRRIGRMSSDVMMSDNNAQ